MNRSHKQSVCQAQQLGFAPGPPRGGAPSFLRPGPLGAAPPATPEREARALEQLVPELLRRLGHDPSVAEVAAYWPRIHAANRALIGPDPDLVRPGVPLVLPAPSSQES